MFMAEFIFRGTTRLSWLENVGDLLGSPEEGVKADTGADVEDFRGKEDAAGPRAACAGVTPLRLK